MFRSLNVAATGMAAQETQLDTISNNLANANTTGYKSQTAQFEDLLYQNVRAPTQNADANVAPTQTQIGTGVRIIATARSFSEGTIQQTGNSLDMAIEGQGSSPSRSRTARRPTRATVPSSSTRKAASRRPTACRSSRPSSCRPTPPP